MKKFFISSLFIVLLFILAACGGEEADTSESTQESTGDSNEVNIIASNFAFDQEEYTVSAGEEVTFTLTNEEGHHGIAIDELGVEIEGEGEATLVPEEPGEYTIYCNIFCGEGHDDMVATLVVQ